MKKIYLIIYFYFIRNSYQLEEEEKKIIEIFNYFNDNNTNTTNIESNEVYMAPFLHFLFGAFFIATIISSILIFFDLNEDNKMLNTYSLSNKERVKLEYKKLKSTFINSNIFIYSFFVMKYTYPFFNIFFTYNYDHPRYHRYLILIISILANFLISNAFYKFFKIDEKGEEFVSYLLVFIFSLFASFIIYIFTQLITIKILGYDKKRKDIWKPKIESIKKYIYYTVKKDILFNSKWHSIKNRIVSYTRICGTTILNNKINDKYKNYMDNKIRNNASTLTDTSSLLSEHSSHNSEKDKEILTDNYISSTINLKEKENNNLPSANNKRKKTFFSKNNEKDNNSSLLIDKSVESFSFSKMGQNNIKLKTLKRIEGIRNRYILSKNDIKFDETLDVSIYLKTYSNLEIETLDNYTYISTDSISNQINNNKKKSSDSKKIYQSLMSTFVLLLILTLFNSGLFFIQNVFNNDDNSFYTKFLCPVSFQIIVFNFLIHYLFALFTSFIIFKYYGYNKKNCLKIIFNLFIEKYMIYIYRIRLLIKKYNKELEFIEE